MAQVTEKKRIKFPRARAKKPSYGRIEQIPMSPVEFHSKEQELDALREKSETVVREIGNSFAISGKNDNQEVEFLRNKLSGIRKLMEQLQYELDCATVIVQNDRTKVAPGAIVTLLLVYSDEEIEKDTFLLGTGNDKAISLASPIGNAIIGANVGDTMEVDLPDGEKVNVTVLAFHF